MTGLATTEASLRWGGVYGPQRRGLSPLPLVGAYARLRLFGRRVDSGLPTDTRGFKGILRRCAPQDDRSRDAGGVAALGRGVWAAAAGLVPAPSGRCVRGSAVVREAGGLAPAEGYPGVERDPSALRASG